MTLDQVLIRSFAFASLLILAACGGGGGGGGGGNGGGSGAGDAGGGNASAPVIQGVSPTEARGGETITVRGQGFGGTQGASTLGIGGVPVTQITSWSDTEIVATVPAPARTGNLTITVAGVTSAPTRFVVMWNATNPDNVAVNASASVGVLAHMIADGNGGAVVVWVDFRNGEADLYAQRVDSAGVLQWAADGVPVSIALGEQSQVELVSDGAGGAIVVWVDQRDGTSNLDIYAQRLNADGVAQWTADGVAVVTAGLDQLGLDVVEDGAGGAIVAWIDQRNGIQEIYAQRLNGAGEPQWRIDGVPASASGFNQDRPRLLAHGDGSATVVWGESRPLGDDIYAQRLNGDGLRQWGDDGVAVSSASNSQYSPNIVAGDAGGAIVVWQDLRNGNPDVYAQRLDAAGTAQWAADGVGVVTHGDRQDSPQSVADGVGGVIVVWEGDRNGPDNQDLFAQRLNSAGVAQWAIDGVEVVMAPGNQEDPLAISDGAGGVIVSWTDRRGSNRDIYAQRLNPSGERRWTFNGIFPQGVPVSTAANDQMASLLVPDAAGGAIAAWTDARGIIGVYAQGITANGVP